MKPRFDVRKSFNELLNILCSKTRDPYNVLPFLTEEERMQVINAGLAKNYKAKSKKRR